MMKALALIGATLTAVFIVSFQLGVLPFFMPLFAGANLTWRIIYYGFWLLAVLVFGLTYVSNREVRRNSFTVLIFCGLSLSLVILHPIDQIAKNFIVAIVMVGTITVLSLGSSAVSMLRFSAVVTTLSAIVCLLDIAFVDGFTNSAGRGAGFGINPNVAAAGLLIGYASSNWTVPPRFRMSFFVLTFAAIVVTLSKSILFLTALLLFVSVSMRLIAGRTKGRPDTLPLVGFGAASVTLLAVCLWIAGALWANDRFLVAATDSFSGLRGAFAAFDDAKKSIQQLIVDNGAMTGDASGSLDAEHQAQAARIEAMGMVATDQGMTNSVSARGVLFQRSLLAYEAGPFFGQGLAYAHALSPHNSFLLFAVAFGTLGWLVPFGITAIAFGRLRDLRYIQLGMATFSILMISHDVLFSPQLLIPIALGIAGLRTSPSVPCIETSVQGCLRYMPAITQALFALGCLAVLWRISGTVTAEIDTEQIRHESGYAYVYQIPRPPFAGLLRIDEVDPKYRTSDKRIILIENGIVLSDEPAPAEAVSRFGEGLYSMWRRYTLVFSARDNTDPSQNGRSYSIKIPVSPHPLLFLVFAVGIACSLWAFALPSAGRDRRP